MRCPIERVSWSENSSALIGFGRCSFRVVTGRHLLRTKFDSVVSRLGESTWLSVVVSVDISMDACQRA